MAARALEVDAEGRFVHDTVVLTTPRQSGKDLDCGTPMLTGRGWTTMGDLRAGDTVFAPDGTTTEVLVAHPPALAPFGAYRVTLTDGRSLVAGGEHLWEVFRNGARRVMTTLQLAEAELSRARTTTLNGKLYDTREYRFHLADQSPVDLPDTDLPIDPWLLGYWLGNGTARESEVTVAAGDVGHVERRIAESGAYVTNRYPNPAGTAVRLGVSTQPARATRLPNVDGRRVYSDSLLRRLHTTGVLENKHIPAAYLCAGTAQRLALLRGLMDSDGYAPVKGTGLELCFTRERLALDALTLIRSLGYQPRCSESEARIGGRYISQRWRIRFSVSRGMPVPFALPRKVDRVVEAGRRQRPAVASIVRVPDRPMRCITVDRADGMFLAGRDLVPTHNSWLLREIMLWRLGLAADLGEVQTVLHTAMRLKHAQAIWLPAARWALGADGWGARFANGQERITAGDGSVWELQAASDGLGVSMSVSLGVVDEAWGIPRDLVDNALLPTMAEAEQPQLWVTSTSGVMARGELVTDLVPSLREAAVSGTAPGLLLLEWSAPRAADPDDPVTWRAASPFWDARREQRVMSAHARMRPDDFARQWLNVWPAVEDLRPRTVEARFPERLLAAAGVPGVQVAAARRVVAVGKDAGGAWLVAWAGLAAGSVPSSGSVQVVAGGVSVHGSMESARAAAELVVAAGAGVLLIPAALRGYVRVKGCRGGPVLLRDSDTDAALGVVGWRLEQGGVVHDGDRGVLRALGSVPPTKPARGTWDAGILLAAAVWWAGRIDAPTSRVV